MSKLDNLIKDGRSGIVAICGNPENRDTLEFMVYFHSLGAVFIHCEWQDQYFDADAARLVAQATNEFENRQDKFDPAEAGINESDFLRKELGSLLWHMTHDDEDIPDGVEETEWLGRAGLQAPDSLVYDPCDENDTIFGSADLETDIAHFGDLAKTGGDFSVAGHDFSLDSDLDDNGKTVYRLGRIFPDFLIDDATGERIPFKRVETYLHNYDWRNLYARTRIFITQNY